MKTNARCPLWKTEVVICALGILCLSRAPVTAADTSANPPASQASAVVKGQRVFVCGHSFHIYLAAKLDYVTHWAGIKGRQVVDSWAIGGSRVYTFWNQPDEENKLKTALRHGNVDVLTLSPIWLPDDGIEKYARLGLQHNPNIRVLVQKFWLPNDDYVPVYGGGEHSRRNGFDRDATDLVELGKSQARYDHDIDDYVRDINQRLGKQVIFTVPVGKALLALREKIAKGQAPGLKTQAQLFEDSWGHAKPPVDMLGTYCFFAAIYHRNPVGLQPANAAKIPNWNPEQAHLLQELAWEAVTSEPLSGVEAGANGPSETVPKTSGKMPGPEQK